MGSGARVVISTGTKNLQEQLMDKDIPFLQEILPAKFRAAFMKGRNNYACLHRIKHAESMPVLEGLEQIDQFDEVFRWSTSTETGDRAELYNLPENLPFWRHIDARSETCLGQKCPDFDPCFITRMRQRAMDADIIVVNHHLFFADLALRNGAYGAVLPDYAAVILDEAHQIEDVASEYFGAQVSNYQVDDLLRDLGWIEARRRRSDTRVDAHQRAHSQVCRCFLDLVSRRPWGGRKICADATRGQSHRGGGPGFLTNAGEAPATPAESSIDSYHALDNALHRLETTLDILKDPPPDAESLLRRDARAALLAQLHRQRRRPEICLLARTTRPRNFPARFAD